MKALLCRCLRQWSGAFEGKRASQQIFIRRCDLAVCQYRRACQSLFHGCGLPRAADGQRERAAHEQQRGDVACRGHQERRAHRPAFIVGNILFPVSRQWCTDGNKIGTHLDVVCLGGGDGRIIPIYDDILTCHIIRCFVPRCLVEPEVCTFL